MTVATSRTEVGVRDLKNNLSRYLDRVQEGEEVIVTDRGKPVARLLPLDHSTDRLAANRRRSCSPTEEHDPFSSGATHQAQGIGERPRRRSAALIAYVDTSSLLKLLIEEPGSEQAGRLWDTADALVSIALVVVEARAALAAAQRGARLTAAQHVDAKSELNILVDELTMVEITDDLIANAAELADREALRGYDAVHLAAAVTIGVDVLTSADSALCAAGERCGLNVANPLEP